MVSVGLVATAGNCASRNFGLKCFMTDSVTAPANSLNFEEFLPDMERLKSELSVDTDCDDWGEASEEGGGVGKSSLSKDIVV